MTFKKGVSTWSYLAARISVEDMMAAIAEAGGKGVEILPAMNPICDYPNYTPDDVAKWKDLMAKYDLEPVSNASMIICVTEGNEPHFLPQGQQVHKNPTHAEMVQLMKDEIDFTYDFGFKILRHPLMNGMSFAAIEDSLKYAEDKGIGLDLEIHTPFMLDGPEVQTQIEMIEKHNAKFAGIIPDLNAFQDHLPASLRSMVLQQGAEEEILNYIDGALAAHENMGAIMGEIQGKTENKATLNYAGAAAQLSPNLLEDLRPLAKYINHFHAKFFDITEEGVDTALDYKLYMNFLKEIGYDKWMISEYEGSFYHPTQGTESVEQVKRHIKMMERIEKEL